MILKILYLFLCIFALEHKTHAAADRLEDYYPPEYLCPLQHNIMREPVMTEHLQTYDRVNIERYFEFCRARGEQLKDPLTNLPLGSDALRRNFALQSAIEHHLPLARAQMSQEESINAQKKFINAVSDAIPKLVPIVCSFVEGVTQSLKASAAFQEKTAKSLEDMVDIQKDMHKKNSSVPKSLVFSNILLENHAKKSRTSYVIYFLNYSGEELELQADPLYRGDWCKIKETRGLVAKNPPKIIRKNEGVVWASESNGYGGPKGMVKYIAGLEQIQIDWHNPIFGSNDFSIKTGDHNYNRIQLIDVVDGSNAVVQVSFFPLDRS